MSGAQLTGDLIAESAVIEGYAVLSAYDGRMSGLARTFLFTVHGLVFFSGVRITGSLHMSGARITGDLIAESAVIEGYVMLSARNGEISGLDETFPFTVEGNVDFSGVRITGSLNMSGARITGDLIADSAVIEGYVILSARNGKISGLDETLPFETKGEVSLSGARISGSLDMSGARLGRGLYAKDVVIGASAILAQYYGKIAGKAKVFPLISQGRVSLSEANIKGALYMPGGRFKEIFDHGVDLKNLKVGGYVSFFPFLWRHFSFGLGKRFAQSFLPFCLLVLVWLMGIVGVEWADEGHVTIHMPVIGAPFNAHELSLLPDIKPVMVLDTGTINTLNEDELRQMPSGLAAGEYLCKNNIDPIIYAADLLIPYLDLHQEHRCTVTSAPLGGIWRWWGTIYIILGWILVSWLIFNIAGLMESGASRKRD